MFDFASITEVRLSSGSHERPEDGLCFMEMVSWFAGEAHSDKPACACPVLGCYGIVLNDNMPDDLRDRLLKPIVPLIAGTHGSFEDRLRRAAFLTMWTVNRILPIALRAAGLEEHATACAAAADLTAAKAAADAAREQVFTIAVEGLRQAVLLGRHDGFDVAADLVGRHDALRTLVGADSVASA